jgi:hypothetical protein
MELYLHSYICLYGEVFGKALGPTLPFINIKLTNLANRMLLTLPTTSPLIHNLHIYIYIYMRVCVHLYIFCSQ